MSKAHRILSRGTTEKYAEAIAQLHAPGDCVLVVRGVPRTVVMVCPDGCGETLTVNLDPRTGKAWRKYEQNGKLTIYPSVWRDTGCRAHFIIWNDRILWCDTSDSASVTIDEALIETVFNSLPTGNPSHFEMLAEHLNAIPWDVLWACKELMRRGCAQVENQNTFRRLGNKYIPPTISGRLNILA